MNGSALESIVIRPRFLDMIIWRYKYCDDSAPSGEVNDYHYTRIAAEAAAHKVEARKPKGYRNLGIEQIDVPTISSIG